MAALSFDFVTRVVGVTYENRQDLLRDLSAETPTRLVPEPDNPHDPTAVAVYGQFSAESQLGRKEWQRIGYIPRFAKGCNACLYIVSKHEFAFWCPRCELGKIEPMQLGLRVYNLLRAGQRVEVTIDRVMRRRAEDHSLGLLVRVCVNPTTPVKRFEADEMPDDTSSTDAREL
ncbi:MAG: hypothetical protein HYV63_00930 [Candidatus Schekmanbacteria bacterium]|nr:hypothetical protein [Candidatus Schekmanbacteria bacterium]